MRRLPPVAAPRLFEAAGRHGGFSTAATELGVTPSAVSHGVRSLEEASGLSLFHRSLRGLALTPAGETLLAKASRAFEGLSRCVEALGEKQPQNRLVGSIAPTFAGRWLLPRLRELRRRHPLLDLAISTEREHVQLGDGRFDFAILTALARTGPAEWHRLAQVQLVPVAAPDCRMSLAQALARRPAIHVTSTGEDWPEWAALRGVAAPNPYRGLRFDTIRMALDAAGRGLGVALARLPAYADDIASGQLRALDDRSKAEAPTGWRRAPAS